MGCGGKKDRITLVNGRINSRTVVVKRVVGSTHIAQTPVIDMQSIISTGAQGNLQRPSSLRLGVHGRS
jgi:hypothetical protein